MFPIVGILTLCFFINPIWVSDLGLHHKIAYFNFEVDIRLLIL
jgi:hypothetical protein